MQDKTPIRRQSYAKVSVSTDDFDAASDAAETIKRTLLVAHFMISAAGLVFAASMAVLVIGFGIEPFASNPGLTVVLTAVAGLCIGLLAGIRYRARYHQYQ